MGFGEGGEGVFSIKRRKRIVVSDIFLNFAFAILVGCMGDDIVSCLFIYIKGIGGENGLLILDNRK